MRPLWACSCCTWRTGRSLPPAAHKAHNRIFKGLFKLGRLGTSQAFVCRNILTFKEVIRKNIIAFKTKIFNRDNVLAKAAASNSFFLFSSKISLKWNKNLY